MNWLLDRGLGMDYGGHSWLLNPLSFFAVATLVITWQSVPFVAFTLYAGPHPGAGDVLEAAQLDGADARQRFRLIIVPFIKPILLILTVLQVIWDLRVFTQIFALQDSGGITEKTSTIGVYIYQVGRRAGTLRHRQRHRRDHGVMMLTVSFVYVRQIVARRTCEHLHRLARPVATCPWRPRLRVRRWCRCPERESSTSYGVHGGGARASW